ncbi:MAG: hypothetical protein ABH846_03625 [Patescibacteria group bacterium]
MIIWGAMVFSVLTIIFLLVFFRKQTKGWELLIVVLVPFCFVGIAKLIVDYVPALDVEWWGGHVVKVIYYEDWDEETCWPTYDDEGNYTGEDCSYTYHPEEYWILDSNGDMTIINSSVYSRLHKKFGRPKKHFVDMGRSYDTNDGDMYWFKWDGREETFEPVITRKTYINKIIASSSCYSYPKVTDEEYEMYRPYEYPEIYSFYKRDYILGDAGSGTAKAQQMLTYWNAKLGKKKEVQMMVLVFKNKSEQAGFIQEAYWQGGNKNEFIIAVGVNDANEIQWVRVISWTRVEELKIDARNYVNQMKHQNKTFDVVSLIDWMRTEVDAQFVRLPFATFDFLEVEPPMWMVVVVYILTLIINVIVALWVICNQYRDNRSSFRRFRRRF